MIPSSNINLAVILVINSLPIQTGTIGEGCPIVVYPNFYFIKKLKIF